MSWSSEQKHSIVCEHFSFLLFPMDTNMNRNNWSKSFMFKGSEKNEIPNKNTYKLWVKVCTIELNIQSLPAWVSFGFGVLRQRVQEGIERSSPLTFPFQIQVLIPHACVKAKALKGGLPPSPSLPLSLPLSPWPWDIASSSCIQQLHPAQSIFHNPENCPPPLITKEHSDQAMGLIDVSNTG